MKRPHRREFLRLAASAAALPVVPRIASAQTYPSRPVRIIVPGGAGGNNDLIARVIGQWLSDRLGQPFIIENRPGAGGTLGTEAVVKSAPDGHTLLQVFSGNAIGVTLYDKLSYNFMRDIVPIAAVTHEPQVILIHPSVPARTLPEFIAYAKANPGKINFASTGIGSITQVMPELFKTMASVNLVHVPYRGTPAVMNDLLGGQVQLTFASVPSSIDHIRTGKLRALAVTTATRSQVLPELPTVGEFLPGYEAYNWNGFGAPRNTPAAIVERLNREINAALADPKIKARLTDLGSSLHSGSPAEFGKFIADETEKWGKVIRAANIRL